MNTIEALTKRFGEGIRKSDAKYRFFCPKCNSFHLDANPTKDHVPFICNACGLTGSINTSYDVAPISIYKPPIDWDFISSVYSTLVKVCSLRQSHVDYLINRGIIPNLTRNYCMQSMILLSSDLCAHKLLEFYTEAELIKSGLFVTKFGKSIPAGIIRPNRILIPYYSSSGVIQYIRSRFAGQADDFKFLSPTGVPGNSFSWGWETYDDSTYMIVTEGEFKAQAMKQLGIQCTALSGMQTGHSAYIEQLKKFSIELLYTLFDSDGGYTDAGLLKQTGVDRAVYKLSSLASKAGIEVINCKLPILEYEKMDIDKYCLIKGANAKDEIYRVLASGTRFL